MQEQHYRQPARSGMALAPIRGVVLPASSPSNIGTQVRLPSLASLLPLSSASGPLPHASNNRHHQQHHPRHYPHPAHALSIINSPLLSSSSSSSTGSFSTPSTTSNTPSPSLSMSPTLIAPDSPPASSFPHSSHLHGHHRHHRHGHGHRHQHEHHSSKRRRLSPPITFVPLAPPSLSQSPLSVSRSYPSHSSITPSTQHASQSQARREADSKSSWNPSTVDASLSRRDDISNSNNHDMTLVNGSDTGADSPEVNPNDDPIQSSVTRSSSSQFIPSPFSTASADFDPDSGTGSDSAALNSSINGSREVGGTVGNSDADVSQATHPVSSEGLVVETSPLKNESSSGSARVASPASVTTAPRGDERTTWIPSSSTRTTFVQREDSVSRSRDLYDQASPSDQRNLKRLREGDGERDDDEDSSEAETEHEDAILSPESAVLSPSASTSIGASTTSFRRNSGSGGPDFSDRARSNSVSSINIRPSSSNRPTASLPTPRASLSLPSPLPSHSPITTSYAIPQHPYQPYGHRRKGSNSPTLSPPFSTSTVRRGSVSTAGPVPTTSATLPSPVIQSTHGPNSSYFVTTSSGISLDSPRRPLGTMGATPNAVGATSNHDLSHTSNLTHSPLHGTDRAAVSSPPGSAYESGSARLLSSVSTSRNRHVSSSMSVSTPSLNTTPPRLATAGASSRSRGQGASSVREAFALAPVTNENPDAAMGFESESVGRASSPSGSRASLHGSISKSASLSGTWPNSDDPSDMSQDLSSSKSTSRKHYSSTPKSSPSARPVDAGSAGTAGVDREITGTIAPNGSAVPTILQTASTSPLTLTLLSQSTAFPTVPFPPNLQAGHTGHRKGMTPKEMVPVDAPTQPRRKRTISTVSATDSVSSGVGASLGFREEGEQDAGTTSSTPTPRKTTASRHSTSKINRNSENTPHNGSSAGDGSKNAQASATWSSALSSHAPLGGHVTGEQKRGTKKARTRLSISPPAETPPSQSKPQPQHAKTGDRERGIASVSATTSVGSPSRSLSRLDDEDEMGMVTEGRGGGNPGVKVEASPITTHQLAPELVPKSNDLAASLDPPLPSPVSPSGIVRLSHAQSDDPQQPAAAYSTSSADSGGQTVDPLALKRRQNTIAARRSRQRKLEHVRGLEQQVGELTRERDSLRERVARLEERVGWLGELLGKKGGSSGTNGLVDSIARGSGISTSGRPLVMADNGRSSVRRTVPWEQARDTDELMDELEDEALYASTPHSQSHGHPAPHSRHYHHQSNPPSSSQPAIFSHSPSTYHASRRSPVAHATRTSHSSQHPPSPSDSQRPSLSHAPRTDVPPGRLIPLHPQELATRPLHRTSNTRSRTSREDDDEEEDDDATDLGRSAGHGGKINRDIEEDEELDED